MPIDIQSICYINIEENSGSLNSHRKVSSSVLLNHIEGLRKGDLEYERTGNL